MNKEIKRSNIRMIKHLQKEIDWAEERLDRLIEETPDWNKTLTILLSVKGVGKVLAYTLLSDLPELGQLNRKEIAALVGLASSRLKRGLDWIVDIIAMKSTVRILARPPRILLFPL